jgi:putative FmdB family regulatory protein
MPIYEYRCEKGHRFDVMHSMSDEPVAACEVCGAPVQKVLHAPAVHFKGSGFYTTDYGSGAKSKAAADGGDSKSGDSKSGESGSKDSASKGSDAKGAGSGEKAKASSKTAE